MDKRQQAYFLGFGTVRFNKVVKEHLRAWVERLGIGTVRFSTVVKDKVRISMYVGGFATIQFDVVVKADFSLALTDDSHVTIGGYLTIHML